MVSASSRVVTTSGAVGAATVVAVAGAFAAPPARAADATDQLRFNTPEEAVQALAEATKNKDVPGRKDDGQRSLPRLRKLFGRFRNQG